MKILSWNVNGLTACLKKGFVDKVKGLRADVICLQETKLTEEPELDIPYIKYWNCSQRKGYSGTAIFCRYNPISVRYGIDCEELILKAELLL